jgi:hypothetical protein
MADSSGDEDLDNTGGRSDDTVCETTEQLALRAREIMTAEMPGLLDEGTWNDSDIKSESLGDINKDGVKEKVVYVGLGPETDAHMSVFLTDKQTNCSSDYVGDFMGQSVRLAHKFGSTRLHDLFTVAIVDCKAVITEYKFDAQTQRYLGTRQQGGSDVCTTNPTPPPSPQF